MSTDLLINHPSKECVPNDPPEATVKICGGRIRLDSVAREGNGNGNKRVMKLQVDRPRVPR